MKIGVIGLGIVGNAIEYGFKKLGHEVVGHDIKLDTRIDNVKATSVTFVRVPTPSKKNGRADTSIVEEVVETLV